MTPGFIDDHTHFAQAGALLIGANLLDVHSAGPFAERVKGPWSWISGSRSRVGRGRRTDD